MRMIVCPLPWTRQPCYLRGDSLSSVEHLTLFLGLLVLYVIYGHTFLSLSQNWCFTSSLHLLLLDQHNTVNVSRFRTKHKASRRNCAVSNYSLAPTGSGSCSGSPNFTFQRGSEPPLWCSWSRWWILLLLLPLIFLLKHVNGERIAS